MHKPIDIRSLRRAAGTPKGQTNERAISTDLASDLIGAAMTWEIPLQNSLQIIMLARLAVSFGDLTAGGMVDWLLEDLKYEVTRNAVRHNLRQLVEGGQVRKRENIVSNGKPGPNLATYDISDFGIRLLFIAKDLIDLRREQDAARYTDAGSNSAPTPRAGRT